MITQKIKIYTEKIKLGMFRKDYYKSFSYKLRQTKSIFSMNSNSNCILKCTHVNQVINSNKA